MNDPQVATRQGVGRYLAVGVVILDAIVLLAHDRAHHGLGVLLNPWQQAFVYTVIVPAPIVALALIWKRPRLGYSLLLVSMLGSLVFGVYHHFVAVSTDNVGHLPPGEAQGLFLVTAVVMALVQGAGVVIAGVGLCRHTRKQPISSA